MFLNSFTHALDPKGRMVVPAPFRAELGGVFYLAIGDSGEVDIWPREAFDERVAEKMALAKGDPRREFEMRTFASSASEVVMDAQFRLAIPPSLRAKGGLEPGATVVVNGTLDHAEIWAADRLAVYEQQFTGTGA